MNILEWLKPGIFGALIGAVFVGAVGFSWGGWMTGREAEKMASTRSVDDVAAALIPVCMILSRTDTNRVAKLATIREASSFKQQFALMDAGWATVPGSKGPNRELANACVAALGLAAS